MNTPEQTRALDVLLISKSIRPADAERAQALYASEPNQSFSELLLRLGVVSERDLAFATSTAFDIPVVFSAEISELADRPPAIPARFLKQYRLVPVEWDNTEIHLLVADPSDLPAIEALEYATERKARCSIGLPSEIERLVEQFYGQGRSMMGTLTESLVQTDDHEDDIEHLKDLASEAPVIRLVNLVIQRAVELRASDIHIEPFENILKVRYRVDGVLHESEAPPSSSSAAVISRVKIMAKLDIAERRLPQDGRIMLRIQGKDLDLRVSTMPTSFGESVVMRLLDRQTVSLDFPSLGFDGERLQRFLDVLERPHGIVLVTGPTGSGKTTTLYAALSRLNKPERKIITVEDPVEYQIAGINQTQVKPAIGLDFANALRSIVRQDPDVIMIGEMRDLETCRIAIQSSLTGHLVLSTLHTNSASASITRLMDMGVEPYLIASTVNAILAQRLVRRLVPEECETYEPSAEFIALYGLDRLTVVRPIKLWRPRKGVPDSLAYSGRNAITELLVMSDRLRGLLIERVSATALEQAAREEGLRTLFEDGLRQALMGLTTFEEVLRVTRGE
ncbi:type II secretion system ATPase GspE [Pseudomonas sp. dw_358]|uniref:type II secretion system ATPase GspE n=1 Tax=Pseudomonas sp. dw_358 TaxID=2720083 RepID=UPI001BD5E50D|nr:type II secretion system ATPase GspE [Pseudomonas sp. dw_358]